MAAFLQRPFPSATRYGVSDAQEPIGFGRFRQADISPWTTRFVVPTEEAAFVDSRQRRLLQNLFRWAALAMSGCCVFLVVTLIHTWLCKDDVIANYAAMIGVGVAFPLSGSVAIVCARPAPMIKCLGRHAVEIVSVAYFGLLAVVVVCTDARHIWESLVPGVDDLANGMPAAVAFGWRTSTLLVVLMLAASFMVPLRSIAVLCLLVLDLGLFLCSTMTRQSAGPWEFYPLALFVVCALMCWKGQREMELSERVCFVQVAKFAKSGENQVRPSFLSTALASSTRGTELTSVVVHTSAGSSTSDGQRASSSRPLGYTLSVTGDQVHAQTRVAKKEGPSREIGVQASVLLVSNEIQTEMTFNPFVSTARVLQDMATFTEERLMEQSQKPPPVPGRPRRQVIPDARRVKVVAKFNKRVAASSTAGRPSKGLGTFNPKGTAHGFSSACSDAESTCSSTSDGARSIVSRGTASSHRRSSRSSSNQSQGTPKSSTQEALVGIASDFCQKNTGMCRDLLRLSLSKLPPPSSTGTSSNLRQPGADSEEASWPPSFDGRWVPLPLADGLQALHIFGGTCVDGNGQEAAIEQVDDGLMLCGGKLSFAGNLLVYMRPSGATIAYSCVGHSTEHDSLLINPQGVDLGINGIWKPIQTPLWLTELSIQGDVMADGEGTLHPFARQSHPAARVCRRGMLISVGEHLVCLGTGDNIMSFVRA